MCKSGSGAWSARGMVLSVAPPRAVGKGRAKGVAVPFRCDQVLHCLCLCLFLFGKSVYASSPTRVPLFHITYTLFSHLIPIIFCFSTPLYPFTHLNNLLSFSLHGCFWYYQKSFISPSMLCCLFCVKCKLSYVWSWSTRRACK